MQFMTHWALTHCKALTHCEQHLRATQARQPQARFVLPATGAAWNACARNGNHWLKCQSAAIDKERDTMQLWSNQRFLAIYSGVLTAAFAVTVLAAFTDQPDKASFREITVQRINVVEPDGTLRLVVSNKAQSPGIFVKRKEYQPGFHATAGMIFLKDEGTENGGLIFSGSKDPNGNTSSSGHLSFDRFEQDQVLSLDAAHYNDQSAVGLSMLDRPSWSIVEYLELLQRIANLPPDQQQAEIQRFEQTHPPGARRVLLARNQDQSTSLQLRDTQGRDRVILKVDADGTPRLQFLDADGKVISQLPPG
jgi:hypothetical protein